MLKHHRQNPDTFTCDSSWVSTLSSAGVVAQCRHSIAFLLLSRNAAAWHPLGLVFICPKAKPAGLSGGITGLPATRQGSTTQPIPILLMP